MTTENSANSAFGSTSERPYTLRKRVRGDPGLPITTNRRRVVFNRHLSGECRLKAYPGTFFYGSAVITIGLLGAAVLIAIRGEREAEREGANKRMIPLVGILLFSAGFIGFALWYFWPSDWIVSGTGYLFVIAAILIIIGLDIAWIVSQLSYKPPKATPFYICRDAK